MHRPALAACLLLIALAAPAVEVPAGTAALPAGETLAWGSEPVVAAGSARREIVLNGLWRFVPNAGDKPAEPTGGWGWIRVPGSWRHGGWPGIYNGVAALGSGPLWQGYDKGEAVMAAWYQRPLRIPADWAGKRAVLDFARISTDATVWLDGRQVGSVAWPDGRVELTAALRPGAEQDLRVLVLASAGATEFASFMGTATEQVTRSKAEVRARGLIGDVVLTSLPAGPEISEVFAKPTVEGGTRLDLEVTVDGVAAAQDAVLTAALSDAAGAPVATFEAPVRLSAAAQQTVGAGWPVPGAKLWDLGSPNLYHVEVGLRGVTADAHRVRFGFRQFRIDGRRLLLNGSEIRLRPNLSGIQTNGALVFAQETREHIAIRRAQGYNLTELWPGAVQRRGSEDYQGVAARVADEEGWLITGILPHLGDFISGTGLDAAALAVQARPYRRLRNHPSIIMWGSSGNYFGHHTDQDPRLIGRRGFADADPEYRKRAAIGNQGLALYRAMDPTRPLFTHHGGDVGDLHTCNNYLNLLPLQEREEWLSEWAKTGDMPFFPVEFETPVSLSLMRDRNNHYNADTSEPFLSEYCAGVFGERVYAQEPAGYRRQIIDGYEGKDRWRFRSVRMGEAPAFQDLQVLNQRSLWRSWRALGATILPLPWDDAYTHRSTGRAEVAADPWIVGSRGPWQPKRRQDPYEELPAARALGAHDPQGAGGPTLACIVDAGDITAKDHHAVAGATVAKAALLINDERVPAAWSASWNATLAGNRLAGGESSGTLAVAARELLPLRVALPADAVRSEVVIELTARIAGREHRDRFAVQVYPPAAPAVGEVLAVDPRGESTAALAAVGFAVKPWDGMPAAGRVVVVGRHAFADPAVRALGYAAHVAAGGRLLVLAQERAWYEAGQGLRTSAWSSRRVFSVPTMAGHPVLAGLGEADLRDWNGAGTAVPDRPKAVYEKETHGYPRHGWKWGNNGTVAGLAVEKPQRGGWRPLLQCEFDLAYSPLLELADGDGLVIWCTLDLEARSRPDPVAAQLLRRLVGHAAAWRGEGPRRAAALLGDTRRLAGLELAAAPAQVLPDDLRPVAIGPDAAIDDGALRAWLERGGRALVLLDGARGRLGFAVERRDGALGSLAPPAWPEARGLAASDLRLRNVASIPSLTGAPAGGEIAADGLLARLAVGRGVAILTTIDPALLPAEAQPWFRLSRWRWERSLAQLAGNLGMRARADGKARLADLARDAPRPLAGTWRMRVERALPPAEAGNPHAVIPPVDLAALAEDPATWAPLRVPGAWEDSQAQFDGAIWIRRRVDIPADWAGQKLVLELGAIDDHDAVWFQGERIGGMGAENPDAWRTGRSYSIRPDLVKPGQALIAVRVWDWFGGGGLSGKPEELRLRRADGQGQPIALAGAWAGRIERLLPPAKSPGDLRDPGIATHAAAWHQPTDADAGWQTVRMPAMFEAAFADIDGAVWLRTSVEVPAHWAGRDLQLRLGRVADQAWVWADGRALVASDGVWTVPAVKAGSLAIAVRVFNRQGPGGLLGPAEDLQLALPGDLAGAAWYARGWREDFSTGDDPFRYYRW